MRLSPEKTTELLEWWLKLVGKEIAGLKQNAQGNWKNYSLPIYKGHALAIITMAKLEELLENEYYIELQYFNGTELYSLSYQLTDDGVCEYKGLFADSLSEAVYLAWKAIDKKVGFEELDCILEDTNQQEKTNDQ